MAAVYEKFTFPFFDQLMTERCQPLSMKKWDTIITFIYGQGQGG